MSASRRHKQPPPVPNPTPISPQSIHKFSEDIENSPQVCHQHEQDYHDIDDPLLILPRQTCHTHGYQSDGFKLPADLITKRTRSKCQICHGHDHELVEELKRKNNTQVEYITQLKIRVAVLESQVARAAYDKDALTKSLSIVIDALTRPQMTSKKYLPSLSPDILDSRQNKTTHGKIGKAFYSQIDERISEPEVLERPPSDEGVAAAYVSTTATILNDLLLTSHHETTADIGMKSLDDVLGFDFPPNLTSSLQPVVQDRGTTERESDIRKKLDEHQKPIPNSHVLPSPGVIKTGFEMEGSFRGEDYDSLNHVGMNVLGRERSENCYSRSCSCLNEHSNGFATSGGALRNPLAGSEATRASVPGDLWASLEDRQDAINTHMRWCSGQEMRFPNFFRYGLTYIPTETESNFVRSVLISDLPKDIELRDVLARVRGGSIVASVLCDTVRLTGCMSAKIEFKDQSAAAKYIAFRRQHPISFPCSDSKTVALATVKFISTPTYPLSKRVQSSIHNPIDHTRCLAIPNFPQHLSPQLLEGYALVGKGLRTESLVESYLDDDQILHLEFSGLLAARSSFDTLTNWRFHGGLRVEWGSDPCDGSLEELLDEPAPRASSLFKSPFIDAKVLSGYLESSSNDEKQPLEIGQNNTSDPINIHDKNSAEEYSQQIEVPIISFQTSVLSEGLGEVLDNVASTTLPLPTQLNTIFLAENQLISEENVSGQGTQSEFVGTLPKGNSCGSIVAGGTRTLADCKRPASSARSKYASLVPGFEDQKHAARCKRCHSCSPLNEGVIENDVSRLPSSRLALPGSALLPLKTLPALNPDELQLETDSETKTQTRS